MKKESGERGYFKKYRGSYITDSLLYNLSRYDKDANQQRRALKKYKKSW